MLRHREENLENMQSNQHNFGYSASDYQHNKPAIPQPLLPRQAPSLSTKTSKTSKLPRTKSEYSVTGDEHLLSKHSYYELPVSEASYDPFRASRSPIIPLKSDNVNVTVHRLSSKTSKGSKSHVSRASRGGSLRVEMLRAHSRRGSRISSKHSSTSNSAGRRTAEKQSSRSSSSRSRLSLAGSNLPSGSPLPVMRPSEVHKRGVQFSHLRKSSTASALPFIADADLSSRTPDHRARALRKLASGRSSSYLNDSPLLPADPIVVRKKGVAVLSAPRTTKEPRDNADLEARKASVELGKAMDEAFWRSSMSSSLHSSPTERPFVDTPPSSISRPSPNAAMKDPLVVTESYRNRPLPPTPMVTISTLHPSETPVTYTTRELAEMRDRLAVKYAREGTGNQKYFNDVLHQLDKLMKPIEARDASSESRRIVSAPPDCHYVQGSVDLTGLDVIPEEGKFTDVEDNGMPRKRSAGRGVNAASSKRGCTSIEGVDATIRVVDPSPTSHPTKAVNLTTTPWAPLNIRKSTSISTKSSATSGSDGMTLPKERVHYHNRGKFLSHEAQSDIKFAPLCAAASCSTKFADSTIIATSSLPERRSSFESILANKRLSISGIYLDQSCKLSLI
jgi:serine/threonine-protein kinase HSL1 (negative regulator of Swe1 kinase)